MKEKIEIFIAEDGKTLRDTIIQILNRYNIVTVGEAENGIELMQLLKIKVPDVILLDIEMPLLDGSETLTLINKEYPMAKTIMFSQYDEIEVIKNYISRGARAYFTKNTAIEILIEGINRVKMNGFYHDNINHVFESRKNHCIKKNTFSKREIEIIHLMCKGKSSKQIANDLFIVTKTVEAHRKDIYRKANTYSLPSFIAYAIKEGLNYLS